MLQHVSTGTPETSAVSSTNTFFGIHRVLEAFVGRARWGHRIICEFGVVGRMQPTQPSFQGLSLSRCNSVNTPKA